jgi:hypothetical protein
MASPLSAAVDDSVDTEDASEKHAQLSDLTSFLSIAARRGYRNMDDLEKHGYGPVWTTWGGYAGDNPLEEDGTAGNHLSCEVITVTITVTYHLNLQGSNRSH